MRFASRLPFSVLAVSTLIACLLAVGAGAAQAAPSQQARLTASDAAANDQFGFSVAVSGDTLVVGAFADDVGTNGSQGSASVFVYSGETWTEQAKLIASDGAANDWFGSAVAISGDTVVVGAYAHDEGANDNQGSAYVFVRSGDAWTQQAKLTADDGTALDLFGGSVAISGGTVVVGAEADDVGPHEGQGSVYVFTRSGDVWTQQAHLFASGGAPLDSFGASVAISGDTVVVGADRDDAGGGFGQGSAYVFVRSGAAWTQQARLVASDGAIDQRFGASVAIDGHSTVIGAWGDAEGGSTNQGAAYVFTRTGGTWTQEARLMASDGAAHDMFGETVAISRDTAAVGVHADAVGPNSSQGSAYLFTRNGTWTQQDKLTASDGAAGDSFGISVAIAEDAVVVGANLDDVGGSVDQGSAYVFRLGRSPTVGAQDPTTGIWYLRNSVGTVTQFYYGNPGDVPFVGDWDCDGTDTPGLFRQSDAYAYLRNSNTQGIADVRFFFGNPSDIPLAGDFNGDGCDTLSIYRPSQQRFYIINRLGQNEGGLGAADYFFTFGNPGDQPVVGDWDGDGIDEIGLYRESSGFFYYRTTLTTGVADGQFYFGNPGDRFVSGDWGVVDGADTPAVFRPGTQMWYFRHTLTQGNADNQFGWGQASWLPVAGNYGLG